MPTDLIHHTAKTNAGYNSHIQKQKDETAKIAFSATGLTWIIHGLNNLPKAKILTISCNPNQDMQTLAKHMQKVGIKPLFQSKVFDRPTWVSDQQEDIQSKIYGEPSNSSSLIRSTTDGAWFFVDKGSTIYSTSKTCC